jgi:hypothetical protein
VNKNWLVKVWALPLYIYITSKRGVETSKHKHKGDADSHLNRVLETESFLLAVSGDATVCFLAAYQTDGGLAGLLNSYRSLARLNVSSIYPHTLPQSLFVYLVLARDSR